MVPQKSLKKAHHEAIKKLLMNEVNLSNYHRIPLNVTHAKCHKMVINEKRFHEF